MKLGILITLLVLWIMWKLGVFTLKVLGLLFLIFAIGFIFHVLLIPAIVIAFFIMLVSSLQS